MPGPLPHLLLLHSDQHRFDCVGRQSAGRIQTPALDQLCRDGTRFSHAFTPCPISSPARASLMTGAWPTQHGCQCIPTSELRHAADRTLPTVTGLLREAGYWQGWVGKFHQEVEGTPTDHGVDWFVPSWDYQTWRRGEGLPPVPQENGWFGCVDEACPPEKSALAWQADQVIEAMERARRAGRRFFVRWDPPEPHLPCRPTAAFVERVQEGWLKPWPSWPDPLENKPGVQARQRKIWGVEGWTWEQWRPVVQRYLAVILELDHQIGRIVNVLDDWGLRDETLVMYSTDHGDYCGGHGQIDKHFAMYDDLTRVPLIVRWPGRVPADAVCDAFVSNEIDMATTLLTAGGVAPPPTFQGLDLCEAARNGHNGRPDMFAQYFGTESGLFSQRMVRDRRFKFVFNPTATDEFYDVAEDPGEIINRIDDPALQRDLARLRRRLVEWMASVKDPLLNLWTRSSLLGSAPASG